MEKMDLNKLNQLYRDADEADSDNFKEMRGNLLLVSGEHYTKNASKQFARYRETTPEDQQKLRITKNRIYGASKKYKNSILEKAPGVTIVPKNESEMQDRKDAEMNKAVWDDIKDRHDITSRGRVRSWVNEFVDIGEVATKIFWNPHKGDVVGYEPLIGPDGEPVLELKGVDPMTQMPVTEMVPDEEKPIYSGDFEFEPVFGFNLLRHPSAKSMAESPWLIIRKMVYKKDLYAMLGEDSDVKKALQQSNETDFIVFDTNKTQYEKTKDQVLLKEMHIRACKEYPNGYFFIYTEFGIIAEGEHPFGIYPLVWEGFDEYTTMPRAKSIIKVLRPYQGELNRAASQQATHQITLGDDKVLYQAGSKLAQGALLPGVRGISYQGQSPTILPGRTGDQYSSYQKDIIMEMDEAALLDMVNRKEQHQLDPYALLYQSMSQQAVYKPYVDKFQRFLINVCKTTLRLAKHYLPDNALIYATGKKEIVNIPEFRSTQNLCYEIKVEAMSESIDTMLGKQITFNHLLQYVGKNLRKEDIGKIMKQMPFVNNEESFSDFTLDYENVTNDMLAMERGEQPQINKYMDNEYYIQKITNRMKQPDFKYLNPQVQQTYEMYLQQHQQMVVQKQQDILRAKTEYIPTGGAMITTSMHMPDPDGEGTKQVRVPYDALQWLINLMDTQGNSLSKLESMNQGVLQDLANQLMGGQAQAPRPMM